jgi:hypothetical protein
VLWKGLHHQFKTSRFMRPRTLQKPAQPTCQPACITTCCWLQCSGCHHRLRKRWSPHLSQTPSCQRVSTGWNNMAQRDRNQADRERGWLPAGVQARHWAGRNLHGTAVRVAKHCTAQRIRPGLSGLRAALTPARTRANRLWETLTSRSVIARNRVDPAQPASGAMVLIIRCGPLAVNGMGYAIDSSNA